jgi:lipopolysaccharide export LptBFGC system permease protein LptF
MVFTLQRYVFRELMRVFLLATIALTLVLSLGGILRPVQEYGVGPQQILHILFYFMPITLTFVLPMAALFASALTYGRFAVDNELDACRASGVNLLTLIYPGFVLALLVAIANLLLSFHVMPYFVHLAEKSLKDDARQILFRNIQRKGFYKLPPDGRYLIYADHVDLEHDTLFGVVVAQYEHERVRRLSTSEAARVQFDPHSRFNEVQLAIAKARQIGEPAEDTWAEVGSLLVRAEFRSLLGDKIKFKRVEEMKRIRADLMEFDPIARVAREAYVQLATEMLAQDLGRRFSGAPGAFYELEGRSGSVRLSAKTCSLDKATIITLKPPLLVEEYDARTGVRLRRLESEEEKAEIYVDDNGENPRLGLYLPSVIDTVSGSLITPYVITDLALPDTIRQRLAGRPLLPIVSSRTEAESLLGGPPSSILAKKQDELRRVRARAEAAIKSEMNTRLVFGTGCIPMILIGIGLGILQRGGHLLGAFGASCVPAGLLGAAVICGKRLTESKGAQDLSGMLVMWGGVAFLLLLTAVIYRRLLRR